MIKAFIKWVVVSSAVILLGLVVSCSDGNEMSNGPKPYKFPNIFYFPKELNIPESNPTTEEGVLLGRYLFYDGRLSGRTHPDSLMSCSTCHVQRNGFDTGLDHPDFPGGLPHGLTGIPTSHYALPLVNLVYNSNGYFWNGFIQASNTENSQMGLDLNFKNLESIVWMTIVNPAEIAGDLDRTVQTISLDPIYPPMFKQAFGTEEINIDRISKAIAQFSRTIISHKTRYHQYIEGEVELNEAELRGMELFFSEEADCFHCHGGFLLTTNEYFNNAKDSIFTDPFDRLSVTGDPMDRGAYKAPTLINVALTAPYMHDGRFKTLEEVIDFYSEGLVQSPYTHPLMKYTSTQGVRMTAEEKDDLITFLKALTDHELINDPGLSKPADLNF